MSRRVQSLNADMFKVVADDLVQEAGVIPLMHALAIDTIVAGDALRGIIIHSKSGRGAILAQRIVGATGDADLATCAGAPFHMTASRASRRAESARWPGTSASRSASRR